LYDGLVDLTPEEEQAIRRAAVEAGLDFVRVFGSAVSSPRRARDIDLAIGSRELAPDALAAFSEAVERALKKPVDLVQLRSGLSPLLVREIAARSEALWEATGGRSRYAELIDRLLAVAEDEILSFPPELRAEAVARVQRRLE
jgi:predicted nucleotidyltransferase